MGYKITIEDDDEGVVSSISDASASDACDVVKMFIGSMVSVGFHESSIIAAMENAIDEREYEAAEEECGCRGDCECCYILNCDKREGFPADTEAAIADHEGGC